MIESTPVSMLTSGTSVAITSTPPSTSEAELSLGTTAVSGGEQQATSSVSTTTSLPETTTTARRSATGTTTNAAESSTSTAAVAPDGTTPLPGVATTPAGGGANTQQVRRHYPSHHADARRSLLQSTGIQITVTVYSQTQDGMSNVTSSLNTSALESSGFQVTIPPTNVIDPYQDGAEPTVTYSAGFKVTAVQYDDATSQWLVDIRYTSSIPNTITSLYISRPGTTLPYTQSAKNTYYVSKHPCVIYNAVCCLNDYRSSYEVGAFGQYITDAVGTCNSTVQASNTMGMFSPANNQYIVDHALDAFPDSSVTRVSSNDVRLRIAQTDLSVGGLAMRSPLENNPAGYQLTFFVGMTYLTLLEANAMSVSATQTSITLAISNSISFSFSSSQDYSLVKYVTLNVMQNKWVDGLVERKMQFVQVTCPLFRSTFCTRHLF